MVLLSSIISISISQTMKPYHSDYTNYLIHNANMQEVIISITNLSKCPHMQLPICTISVSPFPLPIIRICILTSKPKNCNSLKVPTAQVRPKDRNFRTKRIIIERQIIVGQLGDISGSVATDKWLTNNQLNLVGDALCFANNWSPFITITKQHNIICYLLT